MGEQGHCFTLQIEGARASSFSPKHRAVPAPLGVRLRRAIPGRDGLLLVRLGGCGLPASACLVAAKYVRIYAAGNRRVQALHLGVFVVAPVILAVLSAALAIVFLPFLLLGGGDRVISLSARVHHLASPSCWVALAPCSFADNEVLALGAEPVPAAFPEPDGAAVPASDATGPGVSVKVRHYGSSSGWFRSSDSSCAASGTANDAESLAAAALRPCQERKKS